MRVPSTERLLQVYCDEVAGAAIAAVPLGAWALLAWGLEAVSRSMPGTMAPVVSALSSMLLCAGLVALGRRRRALARPMMLTLTCSVVALPWVHDVTLSWLSVPQVGGFGDAVWRLIPTNLYGVRGNPIWNWGPTLVLGLAGVASLSVARVLRAVFGRGRRGAAFTVTAMALLATSVCAMGVRHATHPSIAHWLDGFSVLRRVPVRGVVEARPRTAQGTLLAEGVRVWRDGVDARGHVSLRVIAPPMVWSGERLPVSEQGLDCDVDATLTLRRGPAPRTLLSCEQPRWNTHLRRDGIEPITVVEVHSWGACVYAFEVLPRTAPPPAWTVVAALGLLAAFAMLRGDRHLVRGALAAWHPYRVAAPRGDEPRDGRSRALTAVGAVALATHASSPWLLVVWTHLSDLRQWL